MKFIVAAVCISLATAMPVEAQEGWRDAVFADVGGSESELAIRGGVEGAMLSAIGDFDGDGRPDVVRLRVNEGMRQFAVVVTDRTGDHTLKTYPLADLHDCGLDRVERPDVMALCWGHIECERRYDPARPADAITISQFSSGEEHYYRCPEASVQYCLFGWYD